MSQTKENEGYRNIPYELTKPHKLEENPNIPLRVKHEEFFDDLIYYIDAQSRGPWKD